MLVDERQREIIMEIEEEMSCYESLPLLSLNHVSLLCSSVCDSIQFYEQILGFVLIKRPSSFNFNGAWLFNYGIGIHLIENPSIHETDFIHEQRPINPKDNHISFQCTDVGLVTTRLEQMGIKYVTAVVEEGGIKVDQVFFHDPDGYMVELCDCENIPILPISSSSSLSSCTKCFTKPNMNELRPRTCTLSLLMMEHAMMESLSMEMMNFSF